MAGIDAQDVLELAAAEDQQPVEALTTNAADPALGVRIRVRRLDRRPDHSDSFASEDVIEAAAELGVAIVNQEAERLLTIVEVHQQVARLLRGPGACRVRRAGDELDPAALEGDEEEDVDSLQPGGFDGEDITGQGRRRMLAKEVSPRELVPLRRRRHTLTGEDRPHRGRRYADAKASQLAHDPPITPTRVLACELNNQLL
jgi:hypothetical protein